MSLALLKLDKETEEPRRVPAFSVAANYQKNVTTGSPPSCYVYVPRPLIPTKFRKFLLRGDFPIQVDFTSCGQKLGWKVEIEKLDFFHYLPKLCDGLQETHYPYNFIANAAAKEMIQHGGARVLPVVPQLIVPLREALNSHNPPVIISCLEVIQALLKADPNIGPALKVYYRQLLPVLRMYISKNVNLGDGVEFSQRKRANVSDIIEETLSLMEHTGGQDSYINIKYLVPVYESTIYN